MRKYSEIPLAERIAMAKAEAAELDAVENAELAKWKEFHSSPERIEAYKKARTQAEAEVDEDGLTP